MFKIEVDATGRVVLSGRFDASQYEAALAYLDRLERPAVVDLGGLEFIASAGLRVLMITQKRVKAAGGGLKLVNVPPPVLAILRFAGFENIMDVDAG
jgi:stage II sporulation protein AA (anti-sigma F factor antagonist)